MFIAWFAYFFVVPHRADAFSVTVTARPVLQPTLKPHLTPAVTGAQDARFGRVTGQMRHNKLTGANRRLAAVHAHASGV